MNIRIVRPRRRGLPQAPFIAAVVLAAAALLAEFLPFSAGAAQDSAVYSRPEPGVFMTRWLTLGPVPVFPGPADAANDELQEAVFETEQIDPHALGSPRVGKTQAVGVPEYQWKLLDSENGLINFTEALGDSEFAYAYAWAEVHSPEAQTVLAGFGSDDGIRVWLNGELVLSNWISRTPHPDDDIVLLPLKKGKNELLIKIQNKRGGWGFYCRLLGPDLLPEKLIAAVQRGNMDELGLLIDNGADVNAAVGPGLTAFQTARIYGREEIERVLKERGADTTAVMPPTEALAAWLFEPLTEGVSPGAAVLVSRNGSIVFEKGFGYADVGNKVPVTVETKFRIGSITKQFTAASILRLQEDGQLSVTDPLSKYLPGFPRGNEVTIRQLLTHTSGIHSYTDDPDFLEEATQEIDPDDLIETIESYDYDFDPGTQWRYSNSNYFLLGHIIEVVADETYGEFLEDTFFDPLEMDNTGVYHWSTIPTNEATGYSFVDGEFQKAKNWDMTWADGAGALYSMVEDLYRWNEGIFGGEVLSKKSLDAAFTPATLNDGSTAVTPFGGYGYGWFISDLRGVKEIGHGGSLSGFISHLVRYPEYNMTVVILMNSAPTKDITPGQTAADLAQVYLWEHMKPAESYTVDTTVNPATYDDYVGRYEFPMGAVMTITRDGNRLFAQLSGQQRFEIFPLSKDTFFWKVVDANITFVRNESGIVTNAIHHQMGREFNAPKIR
jgi:CubicO group peptidase (beta-lactamase class C family)